jgi:hypothetical protein
LATPRRVFDRRHRLTRHRPRNPQLPCVSPPLETQIL